jgi:hypothetical protein
MRIGDYVQRRIILESSSSIIQESSAGGWRCLQVDSFKSILCNIFIFHGYIQFLGV